MAYNRRNILKRIVDIQNTVLEHTCKGVSQEWVFNNIIAPNYHISRSTFYSYLSVNAKMELRKIEKIEKMQFQIVFK